MRLWTAILVLGLLAGCSRKENKPGGLNDPNIRQPGGVAAPYVGIAPDVNPVGSTPAPNFTNHAQRAVDNIQIPQPPMDGEPPR
jgi:hypothetical protein